MNNLENIECKVLCEEELMSIRGGNSWVPVDLLKFVYDTGYKTGASIGYWLFN